jgi:hypothetical protein
LWWWEKEVGCGGGLFFSLHHKPPLTLNLELIKPKKNTPPHPHRHCKIGIHTQPTGVLKLPGLRWFPVGNDGGPWSAEVLSVVFCPVMAACEPCTGDFHAGGRFWTAVCGILAIFAGLRTRVSLRDGVRMR